MKRKYELDVDFISVKSEKKKQRRQSVKKNRMEKSHIKHGGWLFYC
jgi:hypothetical protein